MCAVVKARLENGLDLKQLVNCFFNLIFATVYTRGLYGRNRRGH